MKVYQVITTYLPDGSDYSHKRIYASLDDAEMAIARNVAQDIQEKETEYYKHWIQELDLVGGGFHATKPGPRLNAQTRG